LEKKKDQLYIKLYFKGETVYEVLVLGIFGRDGFVYEILYLLIDSLFIYVILYLALVYMVFFIEEYWLYFKGFTVFVIWREFGVKKREDGGFKASPEWYIKLFRNCTRNNPNLRYMSFFDCVMFSHMYERYEKYHDIEFKMLKISFYYFCYPYCKVKKKDVLKIFFLYILLKVYYMLGSEKKKVFDRFFQYISHFF